VSTVNVGMASTGSGSGMAVVSDWAKKDTRRSASDPDGKKSCLIFLPPSSARKKTGARNVRLPSRSDGTWW